MTEFVTLTKRGGRAVHVNLNRVEYIAPKGAGAALVFTRLPGLGSDILSVQEAPEDILSRARTSRA